MFVTLSYSVTTLFFQPSRETFLQKIKKLGDFREKPPKIVCQLVYSSHFKSADVHIDILSDTVEEYLNESQGDDDPTVAKFFNQIIIKNIGNVNALDCELLLEKISFKAPTDLLAHPITISKKKVLVGGQDRTYIPKNGGQREADLIEIMTSEDPDGNKKNQLLIANNPVPSKAGTWIVECCLNMSNASIKHCKFEINWDGNWHEHKNNMQIQTKII